MDIAIHRVVGSILGGVLSLLLQTSFAEENPPNSPTVAPEFQCESAFHGKELSPGELSEVLTAHKQWLADPNNPRGGEPIYVGPTWIKPISVRST